MLADLMDTGNNGPRTNFRADYLQEPGKQNAVKLFFDLEFTGLHQNTTPISLGIVSEHGKSFYAEFCDFDHDQVDLWIEENVLAHLKYYNGPTTQMRMTKDETTIYGTRPMVREELRTWLSQFDLTHWWGDCLAYDWVLLCELFGGAMNMPHNVHYIPRDLSTAFDLNGIDPDVNRESFGLRAIPIKMKGAKHNALWDAYVIRACYQILFNPNRA